MNTGAMTWAALLGRWTEFAKSSVALPTDGAGGRWRRVIAPVIGLQAVTHALGELHLVEDPAERSVGLDRAELLIRTHAGEIHDAWSDEPLPVELAELITDARSMLELAGDSGIEWLVAAESAEFDHPGALVGALVAAGFGGDLLVPMPGVPFFEGAVAAYLRPQRGAEIDPELIEVLAAFLGADEGLVGDPSFRVGGRQVYRQFDFASGGPVRDVIAPLSGDPLPGQPLLVHAIIDGDPQPVPLPPRRTAPIAPLPVVEHEPDDDAAG